MRGLQFKLNSEHIGFVLGSLSQNTTHIRNIKQYLLATLYHAPLTIGNYYRSLVSHDIFKVLDDELMQQTIDSIMQVGIVNPAIIRPDPNGGYEMISAHRCLHAAQLVGLHTLPAIVRELTDDEAVLPTNLKLADGRTSSAIVGFFVAFLLSPFGLPMAATLILARFCGLRYWIPDKVYGL